MRETKSLTSGKPRSGARSQCEKLPSQITIKGSRDSHFGKLEEMCELGLAHWAGEGRKGRRRKNILGMGCAWGRSNQARNLGQEKLFPTPEQLILKPWSGACNPGEVF